MSSKSKLLGRKERFVETLTRIKGNIDILQAVEPKTEDIKKMIGFFKDEKQHLENKIEILNKAYDEADELTDKEKKEAELKSQYGDNPDLLKIMLNNLDKLII